MLQKTALPNNGHENAEFCRRFTQVGTLGFLSNMNGSPQRSGCFFPKCWAVVACWWTSKGGCTKKTWICGFHCTYCLLFLSWETKKVDDGHIRGNRSFPNTAKEWRGDVVEVDQRSSDTRNRLPGKSRKLTEKVVFLFYFIIIIIFCIGSTYSSTRLWREVKVSSATLEILFLARFLHEKNFS